ncbi:MAG: hypothetical protein WBM46_00455 [Polyangiales bacterium]|jgi:hypothetical protein
MLSPKKMIPKLFVAALPMTGVGCGGDSPSENLAKSLNAFCLKLVECFPQYVDNPDVCTADYVEYYREYIETISGGCIKVIASYFRCLSKATCEELDNGDYYQCYLDLEDDFIRQCGP